MNALVRRRDVLRERIDRCTLRDDLLAADQRCNVRGRQDVWRARV